MTERRNLRTELSAGTVYLSVPYPLSEQDLADLKEWLAMNVRPLERALLASSRVAPTPATHGLAAVIRSLATPQEPSK